MVRAICYFSLAYPASVPEGEGGGVKILHQLEGFTERLEDFDF